MPPLDTVTIQTALSITRNTLSSATGLANVDPAMDYKEHSDILIPSANSITDTNLFAIKSKSLHILGTRKDMIVRPQIVPVFRQMIPSGRRVCVHACSSLARCLRTEFQEVAASSHHCCRVFPAFIGTMAKLRKAAISFVMSVHPSVCTELSPRRTDFHEI